MLDSFFMPFVCGWFFTARAFFFSAEVKKTAKGRNPPTPFAKGGEEILACSKGYKSVYFCRTEIKIMLQKWRKSSLGGFCWTVDERAGLQHGCSIEILGLHHPDDLFQNSINDDLIFWR